MYNYILSIFNLQVSTNGCNTTNNEKRQQMVSLLVQRSLNKPWYGEKVYEEYKTLQNAYFLEFTSTIITPLTISWTMVSFAFASI